MKNRFNKILFTQQNPYQLALLRVITISLILLFSIPPLKWYLTLSLTNDSFIEPNFLIQFFQYLFGQNILLSGTFIRVIYFSVIITGIFSVLGLFSRISIPLFSIFYTFLVAYLWSFGEVRHPRSVLCWFLIILALSQRSADAYSVDAYFGITSFKNSHWKYGWPNSMLIISLSSAYCFSGLWKLFYQGGVEWLNGYTLQYYLVSKGENFFTHFLINKKWLLIVLSYITIALEIFFPICLFFRKKSKYFLLAAFCFHLGNYILRGENPIFLLWPFIAIGYSFSLNKFFLKFKKILNPN